MGEPVQVGPLTYTVLEAEWHRQLGEGPGARLPAHQFLALRMTVTNGGSREFAIPSMSLIGPGGESYPELTDAQDVPEWLGLYRTLKPADTDRGRVLFDVPRGVYKLRVADDAADPEQERWALIEIPLQLELGPERSQTK